MLYLGYNISSKEELQPIALEALMLGIKEDHFSLKDKSQTLGQLLQIDRSLYDLKKKQLPYFCFSNFKANLRRSENFISTPYLVLDIDKLDPQQMPVLRSQLEGDKRLKFMFKTPSGLGLKLLFEFSEEIFSAKEYHDLGHSFGLAFCRLYNIENNLDKATLEVSRASFLNFDPDAFINEDPIQIDPSEFLLRGSQLEELFSGAKENKEKEVKKNEPTADVYQNILANLGQGKSKDKVSGVVLSDFWVDFLKVLQGLLPAIDCAIKESRSIAYGIQLCIEHKQGGTGEVNLYFGKKGYTVVKSNKAKHQVLVSEILENIVWETVGLLQQIPKEKDYGSLRKV